MKNIYNKTLALILFIGFQNCATLISIPDWNKKNAPVFYSGTRCDFALLFENDSGKWDPVYLTDITFSFLLDTFLFPISLPFAAGMSRWHNTLFQFAPPCYDGESSNFF